MDRLKFDREQKEPEAEGQTIGDILLGIFRPMDGVSPEDAGRHDAAKIVASLCKGRVNGKPKQNES